MKRTILFIFISNLLLLACNKPKEISSMNPVNWEKRRAILHEKDSLIEGSSYLPVYSEIYSITQERTHDLVVTVSMRNISSEDSIYILRADYFDTSGNLIRTYFDQPIFVKPMETVEIVIDQEDKTGGTGANFIFDWATQNENLVPFFEAVMISTSGQQGISFTTRGFER